MEGVLQKIRNERHKAITDHVLTSTQEKRRKEFSISSMFSFPLLLGPPFLPLSNFTFEILHNLVHMFIYFVR
jgi:hypothetical protein